MLVKDDWAKKNQSERLEKTKNGRDTMNARTHTCDVCGKTGLTLGNLNRWHSKNCRGKNESSE